ncbi:MAG TPA: ABC transporter substrate-binding protein [Ramlibacter sp.]|nr:ABC transporter substrate-binding protein [Ramlibacter sp.]
MHKAKTGFVAMAVAALALAPALSLAQDKVTVGHIGDMSSLYSDIDGKGGSSAIQMAIDDFGGKVLGKPIELLTADHLNKADVAAAKAREWVDLRGLNLLISGSNSGAALAVARVAAEKKLVNINTAAATPALTNEQCNPYTIHYVYDSVALAKTTAANIVAQGGRNWYFLTADYSGGLSLEESAAEVVKASGGTVLGRVKHPLNASDFSSFLLQAQNSRAQVLGLANAGGDTVNAIKAAKEFGITKNMKLVATLAFLTDVHSIGLRNAEGLLLTTSWYWDGDEASRKFAQRFFAKMKRMPTDVQAGGYSATMTYLKAVAAAKTTDPDKVMEQLKKTPIDDFYAKGYIRADGRFVHDMHLAQVKSPAESKKPWDYLTIRKTMRGEDAFTTKAESKCALWK